MMSAVLTIMFIWIIYLIYKRYVPVFGVQNIQSLDNLCTKGVTLVDIRDFQTSCRDSINQAFCLPLPYLNRHYHEIDNQHVILVVNDQIEKNLSTRILHKKGFKIVGYYRPATVREERRLYEV